MANTITNTSEDSDAKRIADLQRGDISYERRVVVFYDVLGWRSHIKRAGTASVEISLLRRVILKMARTTRMDRGLDLRVTTFSDNIVLSQKPGPTTPQLLMQLAIWQLGAAINGFLLRGGITVGDVVHEAEAVFGPGMNRAHYLESKCAMFPRIILDPLTISELGEFGSLCSAEHSVTFLDPFRLAFCEHLRTAEFQTAEALKKAGLPAPLGAYAQLTNEEVLSHVADSIRTQMKEPTTWKDFRKLAWLYDRVAKQIKWPLSDTFTRVPP